MVNFIESDEFSLNREQARYGKICLDIEDTLVHTRWNKDSLEKYLQKEYDIQEPLSKIDKSGLISDYAFIAKINEDWGYIDIYYLEIPYDFAGTGLTFMITEVIVSKY